VKSKNWTLPLPEYEYQDVDQGRNGEWQLPKRTMRERMAKDYRDAGYWELNSSECRARLLGIPLQIIVGSDFIILGRSNQVGTRLAWS
jgi:hypothetical protein